MIYRLYSRAPGWLVQDPPTEMRHYWSPEVDVPAHLRRTWHGRTGAQVEAAIIQIQDDEKKRREDLQHLLQVCKRYPEWFLYPENMSMGCGPEHYV